MLGAEATLFSTVLKKFQGFLPKVEVTAVCRVCIKTQMCRGDRQGGCGPDGAYPSR